MVFVCTGNKYLSWPNSIVLLISVVSLDTVFTRSINKDGTIGYVPCFSGKFVCALS